MRIQNIISPLQRSLSAIKLQNLPLLSPVTPDEDTRSVHSESRPTTPVRPPSPKIPSNINWVMLQSHFKAIVAAGCRPGYIPSTREISVSIPTVFLLDIAHHRVLLTWDKKLRAPNRHLTLFVSDPTGAYPLLQPDGSSSSAEHPRFKVGLTTGYKPHIGDTDRTSPVGGGGSSCEGISELERFDMSHILEELLNGDFWDILRLSMKHQLSWAGAELLHYHLQGLRLSAMTDRLVLSVLDGPLRPHIDHAEYEEACILAEYTGYPVNDSCVETALQQQDLNLPLIAFAYVLRRVMLTGRFCLICHRPRANIGTESSQLYMCDPASCAEQFYHKHRGLSLEYEICSNPETVDLLVSLAYNAAHAMGLEPLPTGLGLRVAATDPRTELTKMQDFDKLTWREMCITVRDLIACLPAISEMKAYLERTPRDNSRLFRLPDMDRSVPAAAWIILRWCIASCPVRIDALHHPDEMVKNVGSDWQQFRISLASPEAEQRFAEEVQHAQSVDKNALEYPSLYAFHGSPLDNWHSILRHGLWYRTVVRGRWEGNGIYLAKDAAIAETFATFASSVCQWPNSACIIEKCMTLAEVVNQPTRFVYNYLVHGRSQRNTAKQSKNTLCVGDTGWVICRYLFVKSTPLPGRCLVTADAASEIACRAPSYKQLDPLHRLTRDNTLIAVPDHVQKLSGLVEAWRAAYAEEAYDEVDRMILEANDERAVFPIFCPA
ncbi:hypothetical protein C8Q76DRAFT_752492 [Earliella scabrosa]|nr:hypothetical protein C8Q76DRAFT_752492 [Earliella scabrosa]